MTFYIQISDGQFINQPFYSIKEARVFCAQHRIHGYQILDEYQLQQMREEVQPSRDRSRYSVIKQPYPTRERNVSIPVCRPAVAPNITRSYQSIKPYFRPKKVRNFQGVIE